MRRQRNRGRWFPTSTEGDSFIQMAGTTVAYPIIADGWDEPVNDATFTGPGAAVGLLGATLTNNYLIKRIVGSLFVGAQRQGVGAFESPPDGIIVGAGIFVERTDENGALLNISAWDVLDDDSAQKRWLWRRVWKLGDENFESANSVGRVSWPETNAEYGSLREATHVDVKSKQVVGYESRLWLGISVKTAGSGAASRPIIMHQNLRLFATMVAGNAR